MFEPNDDLLKYLVKLGLADANGKLLSGALVDPTSTTSNTTQGTEYTLNTVTLAAALLNSAKRGLLILAMGTTAANANAKNLKVYLGSTAIATVTGATDSGKDFLVAVLVLRTGANAQIAYALPIVAGAIVTAAAIIATATETEANALAVTVKSANTAAAAASATGKGLVVIPLG